MVGCVAAYGSWTPSATTHPSRLCRATFPDKGRHRSRRLQVVGTLRCGTEGVVAAPCASAMGDIFVGTGVLDCPHSQFKKRLCFYFVSYHSIAARESNTQGFKRYIFGHTAANFSEISVYSVKNSTCLTRKSILLKLSSPCGKKFIVDFGETRRRQVWTFQGVAHRKTQKFLPQGLWVRLSCG